jgi:hypothetical protein
MNAIRFSASARLRMASLLAFATILVFGIATPAGAALASANSTAVCDASVDNGVCIAEVGAAYSSSRVSLDVHVGRATDPTTDPNWQAGNTTIGWSIFVNGQTSPSYVAVMLMDTTQYPAVLTGAITSADGTSVPCFGVPDVAVTFSTTTNAYGIGFPAACVGSPAKLRVRATWAYFDSTVEDFANTPNAAESPCCTVSPDDTVPSATTTTVSPSATNSPVPSSSSVPPHRTSSSEPSTAPTSTSPSTSTSTSTTVPCVTSGLGVSTPTRSDVSAASIAVKRVSAKVSQGSPIPVADASCSSTAISGGAHTIASSGIGSPSSKGQSLAVTGTGPIAPDVVLLGVLLLAIGSIGRVLWVRGKTRVPRD